MENTETTLLTIGDKTIYKIDNSILKNYRLLKFIYLAIINTTLGISILNDKNQYSNTFIFIRDYYFFFEACYLLLYSIKIKTRHTQLSIGFRVISFMYKMIWGYLSIVCFPVIIVYESHKGFTYYFVLALFLLNILYFIGYVLLIFFVLIKIVRFERVDNEDRARQRAYMAIVEDTLDIQAFSNKLKLEGYNEVCCPICYEDYIENESLRVLKCNHYFHINCVNDWLNKNKSCPICRNEHV